MTQPTPNTTGGRAGWIAADTMAASPTSTVMAKPTLPPSVYSSFNTYTRYPLRVVPSQPKYHPRTLGSHTRERGRTPHIIATAHFFIYGALSSLPHETQGGINLNWSAVER